VDQVIPAIGQVIDPTGMEKLLRDASYFKTDDYGRVANHTNIYAGGDAVEGNGGTVTEAVGNGRIAAEAIAASVYHHSMPSIDRGTAVTFDKLNMAYFEHAARAEQPILPVEQRTCDAEIEGSLNAQQITAEAHRCFACGNCMSCDNCWTLCPDSSVLKTQEIASDGSHYVFDYDFCKGCGLCANECPCGYIVMKDEL
jgi:formate dehydrogenase (NADP+) beta subunit